MKNTRTQRILFALMCTTQISINTIGMENEQLKLLPEIQGKIVTTIFDLYLNELEDTIDSYENIKSINELWDKILYWIHFTRFKPLQENICFNNQTREGSTILHHAIQRVLKLGCSMLYLISYLLEHNADPNIQDNYGHTALCYCIRNTGTLSIVNWTNLINLFLDRNAIYNVSWSHSILHILSRSEYDDMTEQILRHTNIKGIINDQNEFHDTPACIAVKSINIKLLRWLIENGADLTIKGSEGKTPLEFALEKKEFRNRFGHDANRGIEPIRNRFGHDANRGIENILELLQGVINTNNQTLKEQQ